MILYAHITYVYIIYHKSFAFIAIKSVYIIIIITLIQSLTQTLYLPLGVSMKTLTANTLYRHSSTPRNYISIWQLKLFHFFFSSSFHSHFNKFQNFNEAQSIWNNASSFRTIITCESLQTKQLLNICIYMCCHCWYIFNTL